MKRHIARNIVIAQVAAFVMLSLCFMRLPVSAQASGTHVLYQDVFIPPSGMAHGQGKRFIIFVPTGSSVRAQVKLHDAQGGIIAQSDDAEIPAGKFHSFDFHRSDLPLAGEAGTGRIQVLGSVRLTFSEAISPVTVSTETFSISDGTSNTIMIGEVLPPLPSGGGGRDVLVGGMGRDNLMGIVPGQKLRVTLFNPPTSGSAAGGHVKVFDGSGAQIAQSPNLIIPPGEFRSFDFNRAAFRLSGEPGTGRVLVRVVTGGTFTLTFNGQTTSAPLPASFELVDTATGKTTVLAGNQCMVFFLGGMPGN